MLLTECRWDLQKEDMWEARMFVLASIHSYIDHS